MNFISTRGLARPLSFTEAVEAGLASDGGLFLPESLPSIADKLAAWERLPYAELAAEFLAIFGTDIARDEWHELARKAYEKFDSPDVAPLRKITEKTFVLELFHGPTLAFKDFALQLLGLLYKRQAARSGKKLAVLGATSGDTGSAAIHGCLGQQGIRIFILYPQGRVAPLQERQMACTGSDNVFAIPVPGTFDDAQRVVKECFGDAGFVAQHNLSAVNSINIARVLAQCVYYIWAWLRLPAEKRADVEFAVPTGNFGNVLAGWLAARMGLPVKSFRVATNQNDILHRFFSTGEYRQGDVQPSHAPSMDIQAASNFERFLYFMLGENAERLREVMAKIKGGETLKLVLPDMRFRSSRMDDGQIERVIARMWKDWQYVLDPHTACAFTDMAADKTTIVLATAHPSKFPDVVKKATGSEPVHPALDALKSKELRTHPLAADAEAVKRFIRSHAG